MVTSLIDRFRSPDVQRADREDAEIVRRTLAGERAAFDALVHRHHADLLCALQRITRNRQDAEDCTQEAFLRAFRSLERFDQARAFRPWLWTIGVRLALQRLERKERRNLSLDAWGEDRGSLPLDSRPHLADHSSVHALEEGLLQRDLERAMDTLDATQRAVVTLCVVDRLSYEEAADVLGVPRGTIMSRLSRARAKLRAALYDARASEETLNG